MINMNYYCVPGVKRVNYGSPAQQMEHIIKAICNYYSIEERVLFSPSRRMEHVYARKMCMFFIRKKTTNSLKTIGDRFGGRDHTTVIHSCNSISDQLYIKDEVVTSDYEKLNNLL